MRLLFISSSLQRGGVEEYSLTIATAAVQQGWDVHVAFPQVPEMSTLVQDFQARGIQYHPLNILERKVYPIRLLDYIANFLMTLLLLIKLRPDLVQINLAGYNACFNSILACGWLKTPTMVVFHLFPEVASFPNLKLKLYAWARSRNQQWIGVSNYNRKQICTSFQADPETVRAIYNGSKVVSQITGTNEAGLALQQQIRAELKLPETSQLALTVGRLADQKGYVDLIPAIPHLIQEFPHLHFIWIGDGEKREALVEQVQAYGVVDRVHFLGYRADVPRFLQAADLFVFPSRFEGQPFAILEAMAYGIPIVASNACGIPELIVDRIHGRLFRKGDSCDLLETLRWALRHPESMQTMAEQAQIQAQNFSEEKMVRETLLLLQDLSGDPTPLSQTGANRPPA
ncbi:glycosyltransferase family 4 protein [Phormidesmis sp. 146-12]